MFLAGTFRGASARLIGLTWGPEDLSAELGAEANRDADGRLPEPYRLARSLCLFGAAAARDVRRSTRSMSISAISTACAATPRRRAATASPAGWRSIRRRSRSSTRCSRRPPEALAQARAIVAAFAAAPGAGAVGIDGVMYDRPHLARAQALLARAEECRRSRLVSRRPSSDRTPCRRRGIRASPRRPCRAAPRDRSTSAGRCGRRPGRPARP